VGCFARRPQRDYHTVAIAREIPDSFADGALSMSGTSGGAAVSASLARRQHAEYLSELRKHLPVYCLPALEENPDCCFVEDAAVAVGREAVATRPGHPSRRGEVPTVARCLERFGMSVLSMRDSDATDDALCDGGDVLYTGRHLFVGMSGRTNRAGYEVLRRTFSRVTEVVEVPAVVQGSYSDVLHLKSAATHVDERTLLLPSGPVGDQLANAMRLEELGYDVVRIPDVLACNVVVVETATNGRHVLAQEACDDESRRLLEETARDRNCTISFVDTTELAKKDAALTCCSVLLSL